MLRRLSRRQPVDTVDGHVTKEPNLSGLEGQKLFFACNKFSVFTKRFKVAAVLFVDTRGHIKVINRLAQNFLAAIGLEKQCAFLLSGFINLSLLLRLRSFLILARRKFATQPDDQ